MSQHSSLKSDSVGKRHRNVLKRHERIQVLQDSDTWGERKSIYKLPKLKLIKLKVKKAKGEKEEAAAAEGETATPAQGEAPPKQASKPAAEQPKTKEKK